MYNLNEKKKHYKITYILGKIGEKITEQHNQNAPL